jgi:MYXO-CTERM domain-containing protein
VYVPGEKLFILASNLRDDEVDELEFGKVDKASVVESPGDDLYLASIDSNDHVLFEFNYQKQGSKTWWTLVSTTEVFDDDDRSGVGIPEPAAVGLLALAAPLLARRRRATHGG